MTRLRADNRGAAILVGFALIVAILILGLAVFQATFVPTETESAEATHDRAIQADMAALGAAIDRSARTGSDRGTALQLAPDYPSWRFLLGPSGAAGTLETQPGEITFENLDVDGNFNSNLHRQNDLTLETRQVVYQPAYFEYDGGATVRYEHGVVGADFEEGDDRLRSSPEQLFDGDAIRLTALHGDFSQSSRSIAVESRAASSAAQSVPISGQNGDPIRFTVTTALSASVWEDALADKPGRLVDSRDGRVTIELDPDEEPYDLYLGSTALNENRDAEAAYLVNVTSQSVSPHGRFTVEARDRYDNPVANARLNVTGCDLEDTFTGGDGRATLRCDQPETGVTIRLDDPERTDIIEYRSYEMVHFNTGPTIVETQPYVEPEVIETTDRRFRTDPGNRDRTRLRVDFEAIGDLHFVEEAGLDPAALESASIEIYERDTAFPVDGQGEPVTAETIPLDGATDESTWRSPWLDPGDYAATIRVTNEDGRTATGYANERRAFPSLSADPGPDREVEVAESIQFDGSGSTGNIESYEWDFGDGTTATGIAPEHSYERAGTYLVTLTVTAPDGETATNTAQVVVQNRPGTIQGTVTQQGTDNRLEGVDIRVLDGDDNEVAATTTDANGDYSVVVDGDETYTVVADGADVGFSTESATVTVPEGGTATQDFELSSLDSSLFGTVRNPDGNPLSGVTVEARDTETGTVVATATTGSDGRYSFEVDGGRSYDVVADGSEIDFSVETATEVAVAPGENVRQDFTLRPWDGSISGTVRNSAGDPLSGVTVDVIDPNTGTVVTTATTDNQGRYSAAVAGDRTYTVRADGSAIGFSVEYQTGVVVGPGQDVTNVDFTLVPRDGSISGQVVNEGEVPIQGVTIRIIDPATGGVVATRTTDSQGRYSAAVAGDRSYDVRADGSGVKYETETRRVTVPPGGSAVANFQLDPIGRAADVVFVPGSQTSFGQANAQYGFALRNEGDVSATITRVSIPRVDGRTPASAIGREQNSPHNVFRPTFTVVDAGGTPTPAAGSLAGTERIFIGGEKADLTNHATLAGGQTVRFTTGEFKTTTTGFQRQNMVGASVVLAVTFGDGSQRTIVISP